MNAVQISHESTEDPPEVFCRQLVEDLADKVEDAFAVNTYGGTRVGIQETTLRHMICLLSQRDKFLFGRSRHARRNTSQGSVCYLLSRFRSHKAFPVTHPLD
ncbi:hypothetical protein AcV7_009050 [Taiwanofungus camphoratus]|nr:hypothetical protein AcV7_010394 [Antrodia cinnamomea]KAI0950653.1 hypothetical protein AcV7_009050 [Antrodia cinnamomea]